MKSSLLIKLNIIEVNLCLFDLTKYFNVKKGKDHMKTLKNNMKTKTNSGTAL